MKRIITGLILILSTFSLAKVCFADNLFDDKNTIVFQLKPFNVSDNRIYIQDVIDGRKDKSNLGIIDQWGNHKNQVVLLGDLRSDLQALANISFPKDDSKTPIILKVNLLRLSEWHGLNRYIKAEAKVAFYREKDGYLGKVYETEAFVEKQNEFFRDKYEAIIREVLEKCLQSFLTSGWTNINPTWEEYQKVAQSTQDTDDTLSLAMPEHRKIVLIEPIYFSSNLCGGGLLQYEYDASQTGWVKVANSTTEIFSLRKDDDSATVYILGGRTGAMRRFGQSNYAFLCEGGIPIGVETATHHYNPFIGLTLQENIIYLPFDNHSIVAKAGFYQIQLFSTDLYTNDSGVKVSIGCQF